MNIKDIKKQLEKLGNDKEKLDFLAKILKETKDSEVKGFIFQTMIELQLKSIERKQDVKGMLLEDSPISERELSSFISRKEEKQPVRASSQSRSLDSQVASSVFNTIQDTSLSSSYIPDIPSQYNGVSSSQSNYTSATDIVTDLRDRFIREGILQQDRGITFEQIDALRNRLKTEMPGMSQESLARYESDILNSISQVRKYKK